MRTAGHPTRFRTRGKHYKWHPADGLVWQYEPREDSSRIRVIALAARNCHSASEARKAVR